MVLLDIEGTTTPIDFVYEVLFPYAREHFEGFLQQHWGEDEVRRQGRLLGPSVDGPEAACQAALEAMDRDLKLGPLKVLQGMIWEDGYRSGVLRARLFDDVAYALGGWKAEGISINIYSSGSVQAQQLLFAHTEEGDLRPWIDRYFDTAVGAKVARESYSAIADQLKVFPRQGLFVTDVVGEARAAFQAGWNVRLSLRPGNPNQPPHPFTEWRRFPNSLRDFETRGD